MKKVLLLCFTLFLNQAALADESVKKPEFSKVVDAVNTAFPDNKIESIKRSPIDAFVEVLMPPSILYVSTDGEYIMTGSLLSMEQKKNLTEQSKKQYRASLLYDLADDELIVFKPEKPKYAVTIFTDVDCAYCRQLHSQIEQYTQAGIAIKYVLTPPGQRGSVNYRKSESVLCAEDKASALTLAKQGKPVEQKVCDNPLAKHSQVARNMGVNGTPFIFFEDGDVLPGYAPAERLLAMLQQKAQLQKQAGLVR